KGMLVALMLDLEIRAATQREHCLDDVLRHLAHQATLDDAGFPEPDGYLAAVETVAGSHGGVFRTFFDRYVAGAAELHYERALAPAGLTLPFKDSAGKDGGPAGWLGIATRPEGRGLAITSVRSDGPSDAAGLYAGDELIAIDGDRVDASRLPQILAVRPP